MTQLLGLLAIAAVVWLLDVLVRPYAKCLACRGSRTHALSSRRAFGDCWVCGGSGKRLRLGARMVRRALRGKDS